MLINIIYIVSKYIYSSVTIKITMNQQLSVVFQNFEFVK